MTRRRVLVTAVIVVLLALGVGPLVVPVPPLEDTVPPRELADPDSRFVEVAGVDVHYKEAGAGEPPLLLLHGFGASVFSWRDVMARFATARRVVAYDRPAFGLTERPLTWDDRNPYAATTQVELATGLMDRLGISQAVLVGNSAGGRVAVDVALAAPHRVAGLVLVSPAIDAGGGGPWRLVGPLLRTPQFDRIGPLLVRSIRSSGPELIERAWHRPERITTEVLAGYRRPLEADHWDRALFELTRAPRGPDPADRLDALAAVPTLVVTGDDDRIVPTAATVALAARIPHAKLEVLTACGHVPQEECPVPFVEAVGRFVEDATHQ